MRVSSPMRTATHFDIFGTDNLAEIILPLSTLVSITLYCPGFTATAELKGSFSERALFTVFFAQGIIIIHDLHSALVLTAVHIYNGNLG